MRWYEYFWLPLLKKMERKEIPKRYHKDGYVVTGGYTLTNYTWADMRLAEKYYKRGLFWKRLLMAVTFKKQQK